MRLNDTHRFLDFLKYAIILIIQINDTIINADPQNNFE
jgi:hypothetical protein